MISRLLYKFCKQYCDRHNGENNDSIETNGELRFLRTHMPFCETVFDVGARQGDWTALALAMNPHAAVHCFEPAGIPYRGLLKRGFPDAVRCNNIGLSSVKGTRTLYLRVGSVYRRSGLVAHPPGAISSATETAGFDTLDNYCAEHAVRRIDFLKLDVEGHEMEVLRGGLGMLGSESIRRIQFEYGGCTIDARVLLKDFFDLFADRPYRFFKIVPRRLEPIDEYDQRLENFQYKNFAVLHNSILNA